MAAVIVLAIVAFAVVRRSRSKNEARQREMPSSIGEKLRPGRQEAGAAELRLVGKSRRPSVNGREPRTRPQGHGNGFGNGKVVSQSGR